MMAKALSAGFHLMAQRVRPVPGGSRDNATYAILIMVVTCMFVFGVRSRPG